MTQKESKTLLAVGAHPDDIDFMASGTVAKLVSEGWSAYYIICTDGSRGSSDPHMTHEKLSLIRKKEQLKAGKILGVREVFFLGHTDTRLVAEDALKEQIVYYIRLLKPSLVISIDPLFYYSQEPLWDGCNFVNHTDHRQAGLAVLDSVFPLARDRLTFLEHEEKGLSPHKVEELWLTSLDKKRNVVDITEHLETKLRAIKAHKSQFEDFSEIKKRVLERARFFAFGEEFTFAESFTKLKMP